ncbi:ABC transporter permease [Streptomyces sp. NRRL S-448]
MGALGVSNTAYVSVLERRSEIGLRRAPGASRRTVAGQFC